MKLNELANLQDPLSEMTVEDLEQISEEAYQEGYDTGWLDALTLLQEKLDEITAELT